MRCTENRFSEQNKKSLATSIRKLEIQMCDDVKLSEGTTSTGLDFSITMREGVGVANVGNWRDVRDFIPNADYHPMDFARKCVNKSPIETYLPDEEAGSRGTIVAWESSGQSNDSFTFESN
jgi:hypothetical protein